MDEVQDPTLSEEIDRLHAEHHRYAQRLEELIQKPYLSADEQLEEVRLKKLKLHAKDLILEVRTSNGAAQGLYRAGGFVECGRRLRYYADPEEDAVLMRMGLL